MALIQREQRGLHNNIVVTHMEFTMALALSSEKVLVDPIDDPKNILKKEGVVDDKRAETQEEIHSSGKEFRVEINPLRCLRLKLMCHPFPFLNG